MVLHPLFNRLMAVFMVNSMFRQGLSSLSNNNDQSLLTVLFLVISIASSEPGILAGFGNVGRCGDFTKS